MPAPVKRRPPAKPAPRPPRNKPVPRRPPIVVNTLIARGGQVPIAHAAAHSGSPAQLTLWGQQLGDAARYVHVDDQVLWGMFGLETDFGQYIDTSSALAAGLMQFIPQTARAYNYPMTNYPDEKQSQQQFTAAALYLRDLYNQHGHSYEGAVWAYSGHGYHLGTVIAKANTRKQPRSGSAPPPAGGGGGGHVEGYVNPLANAHVTAERIDQGVDYAGTGYYTAIGECEILRVVMGGWGSFGNFIEYKLTAPGPLGSHTVYYAEGVNPTVRVGDRLNPGDKVCDLIPGWHSGTEIGWGSDSDTLHTWADLFGGGWTPAQDGASSATRAGISFSVLIGALGGPQGRVEGPIIGSWPEWTPGGNVPHLPQVGVGPGQPPVGPNPTTGVAHDYQWTINAEVAWSAAQVGALAGSHHAHAANFFARAYKYLIAPKQEAHG